MTHEQGAGRFSAEIQAGKIIGEITQWVRTCPGDLGNVCLFFHVENHDVVKALQEIANNIERETRPLIAKYREEETHLSEGALRMKSTRIYQLGMSRPEFSRALDTPENTIFRWETGRNSPHPKTLEKLATILEEQGTPQNLISNSCIHPLDVAYQEEQGRVLITVSAECARFLAAQQERQPR